jgi:ABC-type transporter Mla subunit MlaD
VLKKPSELFKKKEETGQSIETNSQAYQSFKENVQKINSLSNFNETIDSYRKSIDNVNILSEEIADIRSDIKNLLTSEDLDRAMMGQFVVIDETISGVQDKVKTINEKKLREIRDNVREVTSDVNEFLEVEAPKYKKLFFDHERSVDRKYNQFEEHVNGAFNTAVDEIEKALEDIQGQVNERVTGINQEHLASIIEDVKELGKTQEGTYKKLIVDGEIRIDERYNKFEKEVNTRCEDLTSIIGQLTENVSSVEGDYAEVVGILNEKLNNLDAIKESFAGVKDAFGEQQVQFEEYAKTVNEDVGSLKADIARSEKHIKDQDKRVAEYGEFKEEVESKVDGLNETIDKQTSSNDELRESIKQYQENLDVELKQVVDRVGDQQTYNENYQERLDNRVKFQEETAEEYKKEIDEALQGHQAAVNKRIKSLKKEFRFNEEIVKDAITKLDIDGVEQRNYELSSKIKYLEEVFEKFSEKALLTESIVTEPPSTNNSDPLTPLDQNFVTLDQLNQHYRQFLVRIQQQLSTLGGGGEVRLEFLDDIDRSTAKVDGKFLKYEASSGKWVGATGGSGGGGEDTETVRDTIQGYYGYTTDYYTVGVANTTQEIGAGVTTLIQPKVAAVYQYMPTVMSGVNTNPYVGTGATIGTGQTQFSLAGLGTGASCIVRTALAFDPDDDNSNLDIQLKFTTNTATQGTGLTHFTIKKEQALIMNEGADQQYISENLFSFFVGSTLQGTTQSNAGSFNIEVIPTSEGELEVLAVTVNVTT